MADREKYFRALLEAAPDAIVICDSRGRIVVVNAQTERLFGYGRDELVGRDVEILVPERYRHGHVAFRDGYVASPLVRPMGEGRDLFGARADGSEFPVAISLSPVDTDEGTLTIAAIRDITDQKQTEQRIRAILESTPDAMVICDADGRIAMVNAQTERLFGYSRDTLVGRDIEVLVPKRFRSGHVAFRDGYIAKPLVRAMGEGRDLFGSRADGSEFPVAISLSPVDTDEGTLTIAAIRDITDQKQAEQRIRAILESTPDAMVICDAAGRITMVNAQTERLFGYSRDALVGGDIEFLVPKRYRRGHVAFRDGYIAKPLVRPMGEGRDLYAARADGSEFPVAISLSPVDTDEGALVIAAVRDTTEQRESEQKIQELNRRLSRDNRELAAVNKELEAFSYSVSHDLRAPLRAIDGFSQALAEDYDDTLDEQGRNYLNRVRKAAQRMGNLIDDLLKLSRVTRQNVTVQDVDLSRLAGEVADQCRSADPDRVVEVDITPGLSIQGDPRLLRIALENLIGNAWKFTRDRQPARIEFGATSADGQSTYFVRDNGVGFDMAYADKLFAAFQRLHDADAFPGTGIGLATVQRVIHKHGGRIWAEAETGTGATFHFTL